VIQHFRRTRSKHIVGMFVYGCRCCLKRLRHREERWTVVALEFGLLSTRVTLCS